VFAKERQQGRLRNIIIPTGLKIRPIANPYFVDESLHFVEENSKIEDTVLHLSLSQKWANERNTDVSPPPRSFVRAHSGRLARFPLLLYGLFTKHLFAQSAL
jgi:hypothetical protein